MASAARAFDDRNAPEIDLIEDCVHCGFCLPTCPTYLLWGEEMNSPRGRIVLMKAGLEEGSELSTAMTAAFDNCIGCMACVTSCPSGVQYDKLIEDTRQQVERGYGRPRADALFRRLLFETFPRPGRLRALAAGLAAYRGLGLDRLVRRSGVLGRFPRVRTLERLTPKVALGEALRPLPELTPARGPRRGRVGLLQGCVQRVFFRQVNVATARVLAAEGFDVVAPREPACCGALAYHAGAEQERTTALAKRTIEAFEDVDHLVLNSAGCGSVIKHYEHQLRAEPAWAERGRELGARARDVSELLDEVGSVTRKRPLELRVAYHDACHLAHAQGVREQPRALLRSIPGLELLEPAEWEICCGSAGVYNLLHPDTSGELGSRKAENLAATGAEAIASANPGCSLQIATALGELGRPLPVHHPIELLATSIGGAPRDLARRVHAGADGGADHAADRPGPLATAS